MLNTKIKQTYLLKSTLAGAVSVLFIVAGIAGQLGAQAAFTQGFATDQPLQKGMIVRLKEGDASKVEPLSFKDLDEMYGVVVDPNDAPVTLSAEGDKEFVATAGRFEVLVSNQNGQIEAGDYVTISALQGIGMKAGNLEPVIVGRALADFDGKSKLIGTTAIKDSAGGQQEVKLGRVLADIGVKRNPLHRSEEPNMPEFLRVASETIAGKPVEATRVYISMAVFVITTIVSASLLYGGVRSGITSIGRNPLSRKLIIRGMIKVIVAGIIIFIIGVFGVYLLLKL